VSHYSGTHDTFTVSHHNDTSVNICASIIHNRHSSHHDVDYTGCGYQGCSSNHVNCGVSYDVVLVVMVELMVIMLNLVLVVTVV
jgi:hypothetical protein